MPRGLRSIKPTIFSLLDTPAFGGAEQYMYSNLRFLYEQGYSVVLATNNPFVKKEFMKRLANLDASSFHIIDAPYLLDAIGNWKGLVKYFISVPFAVAWFVLTLWKLTRTQQVICLFPGWSDRVTFSPFVKIFRIPLLWIEIGPLDPLFKRNWGFPRLLYMLTRRFPDQILTTCKYTLETIVKAGGIARSKISLVYPGTPLFNKSKMDSLQKIGRAWRKKQKLEKAFLLTWLGRLASENQTDLLLNAVAHIQKYQLIPLKSQQPFRVVIVGDGPERVKYQKLAKKLKINHLVHFTGFVEEETKYSILATSNLFTFTRSWEWDGFGMTTIEAMSLGVPIINPEFGPQREIIIDGKSGVHFVPNDYKSLAEQIVRLYSNKTLRQKIARNGKERVEFFSEENMHRNMLKAVKQF